MDYDKIEKLLDFFKKYTLLKIGNLEITHESDKEDSIRGKYETFKIIRNKGGLNMECDAQETKATQEMYNGLSDEEIIRRLRERRDKLKKITNTYQQEKGGYSWSKEQYALETLNWILGGEDEN